MSSVRKRRLLAFGLGCLAALTLAAAGELVFGLLFRLHMDEPLRVSRRTGPPPDNRAVLGEAKTRLGVFPVPPLPVADKTEAELPFSEFSDRLDAQERREPPDQRRLGATLVMLPSVSHRSIMETKDGRRLWDIPVVIDGLQRRETPGQEKKRAGRFVLLFGDSYVQGTGLRQEETQAYFLARGLPGRRVYNYGIVGLFPGEALDWIREIKPRDLGERRGTVLYFFSGYHLKRNMGSLSALRYEGMTHKPRYFAGEGGHIIAARTWGQSRPVWCALAELFWRSNAVRYLQADVPWGFSENDYAFQIKLLEQMRQEAERLGADDFRVVLTPWDNGQARDLIPHLEKAGIAYVDFSHWFLNELTRGPAWLWDGHASPESQELVAGALARALQAR